MRTRRNRAVRFLHAGVASRRIETPFAPAGAECRPCPVVVGPSYGGGSIPDLPSADGVLVAEQETAFDSVATKPVGLINRCIEVCAADMVSHL